MYYWYGANLEDSREGGQIKIIFLKIYGWETK
jgi:hypothetical protein